MYLIDTSTLLELRLDQEKADEVEQFLRKTVTERLYVSDFSLYSMGIILVRREKYDEFLRSLNDLVVAGVNIVRLDASDLSTVMDGSKKFNLDFDDAYQYTLAEKYNLTIVSFDKDFDRTERGRKTPEMVPKASE